MRLILILHNCIEQYTVNSMKMNIELNVREKMTQNNTYMDF